MRTVEWLALGVAAAIVCVWSVAVWKVARMRDDSQPQPLEHDQRHHEEASDWYIPHGHDC
ncbi:hypothetical protein [Streptomyces sp. NPDC048611]|uniref:hypothetical protein n=1 Tax=Streptomyces sp. NPDC048611 TaxID=3155635 RepID=UPI0034253BF4